MRPQLLRSGLLLLALLGGFALGYWLRLPAMSTGAPGSPPRQSTASETRTPAAASAELAAAILSRDPFGLQRNQPLNPAAAGLPSAAASTAGAIEWRLAALSASRSERWMLLTAPDQIPMRLTQGDTLPNGEKVLHIALSHVVLQDRRGKRRTLYLTEP